MSGKFGLIIELGNEAMKDPAHVAEMLREVATHIIETVTADAEVDIKIGIVDDNGDSCGQWKYEFTPEGDDEDE